MAIASKWMAATSTAPASRCSASTSRRMAGDGCLMEGISGEAASLAGHLKLDNLCWIYDNNHITIEGHTDLAFSEDVATRFIGYGWSVTRVGDANDLAMLDRAFETARKTQRPADPDHRGQPHRLRRAHQAGHPRRPRRAPGRRGDPAHQALLRLARGREVPRARRRPRALRRAASAPAGRSCGASGWRSSRPTRRSTRKRPTRSSGCSTGSFPKAGTRRCPIFPADAKGLAGRDASAKVLNAVAPSMPWLIGGSADLAPSTKTRLTFEGAGDFEAGSYAGRNFHFGIREHAMGAVLNGLSLSKVRPYGSGFLIFSDYGRAAHPPGRAHGDPGHLRLHPRLHRRGGGRAHAPAGGAAPVAARDPGPGDDPSRRRQRGGRGLARDPAVPPRARLR